MGAVYIVYMRTCQATCLKWPSRAYYKYYAWCAVCQRAVPKQILVVKPRKGRFCPCCHARVRHMRRWWGRGEKKAVKYVDAEKYLGDI